METQYVVTFIQPKNKFDKPLNILFPIDWGQEEKGTTEDEMVGWHHQLNGHGFGWTPGAGDGQGGLVAAVHGVTKSWTWLSDWTELIESLKSHLNYLWINVFFLN